MPRLQHQPAHSSDTLERRLRYAKPCPRVHRLILTPADYLIFAAIDRHGPLPTGYLYHYTRHLRRDLSHLQNRLTELYNGDAAHQRAGAWLIRPPAQFASFAARYQHLVHGLAPRARELLAERGMAARYPRGNGPFVHQLMAACVAASLELGASAKGIRYIPREEIFAHSGCTATTQTAQPLAIPLNNNRTLIPDDLFGFAYPEGGYRFFALEVDRGTEAITGTRSSKSAYAGKLTAYAEIIDRRLYKVWWGVPNLTVLTVTTSQARATHMLDFVHRTVSHAERFAFTSEPMFGPNWRVPNDLLHQLIDEEWHTVRGGWRIDRP